MTMGNDIGFTYADGVSMEDIFDYHYGAFVLELTGDAEVGTLLGTTGGKAIICGGESIALEEIFAAYENKLEEIYPMHTAAEEKKEIPHSLQRQRVFSTMQRRQLRSLVF